MPIADLGGYHKSDYQLYTVSTTHSYFFKLKNSLDFSENFNQSTFILQCRFKVFIIFFSKLIFIYISDTPFLLFNHAECLCLAFIFNFVLRINAHNVWEPPVSVIMLLSNVPLNSLCHLKKVEFVYRGRGDTRASLVFSISMGVFDLLHKLD